MVDVGCWRDGWLVGWLDDIELQLMLMLVLNFISF